MSVERRPAVLTVDLEDYRSIRLRDYGSVPQRVDPEELEGQVYALLELLESIGASATFFCVGRLTEDLRESVWRDIVRKHPLGAHSFDHQRVWELGERRFESDLVRTKSVLEDVSGEAVLSYRAPYFSNLGCHPWFGEVLARSGIVIDSSIRISLPPRGFRGTLVLEGSAGAVTEVPFPSLGIGGTRLTIIGGTYFRLLSLGVIRFLLGLAERQGFIPMVYLHPYDIDPHAPPLQAAGARRRWALRGGDRIRRTGRSTAAAKLRALCDTYSFTPLETVTTGSVL